MDMASQEQPLPGEPLRLSFPLLGMDPTDVAPRGPLAHRALRTRMVPARLLTTKS